MVFRFFFNIFNVKKRIFQIIDDELLFRTFADIDECRITCACPEEQECVNWPGSYSCETQEPGTEEFFKLL